MIIDFKVIPHKRQRYNTAGDYFLKHGRWIFRVSRMKDRRYPIAVFLHEMIECFMCRVLGVRAKEIDRFDMEYERLRSKGITPCGCNPHEEPGDDPHAPYHRPHLVATQCERLICEALGIKWEQYCEVVASL